MPDFIMLSNKHVHFEISLIIQIKHSPPPNPFINIISVSDSKGEEQFLFRAKIQVLNHSFTLINMELFCTKQQLISW